MRKFVSVISLLLALALLCTACGSDSTSSSLAPGSSSAGSTGAQTLTIVHVNDIHGNVEPTETAIGYPKIAAFIEDMKAQDPNTLAFDAGDTFAGTPNAAFDKGESIVPILNTIDFDAFTLGNNDFYLGLEQAQKLSDALSYPVLAANVANTEGEKPWDASAIVEMPNGLVVGIISATCGGGADYEFQDPIASLKADVAALRDQVDVLVALLHLGVEDDSGNTSVKVANEVEGIDVIIDAHSHTVLENGMVENGVLIAQTGEYSNNIGVVTLTVENGQVGEVAAKLVSWEEMKDYREKEDTAAALAELLEKSDVYFSQVVGETAVDLEGARDDVRSRETNMGNLVADAVREATGADIAIAIAGTIGGEIPAGEITKRDVLSIARVSVNFQLFEMTGAEVLEILNGSCNSFPEPAGNFAQVSGITMKIDPAQPENERVHSVMVDGKPLDLEGTYKVAVSGQSADGRGTLLDDSFPASEVIIEEYIAAHSPVAPEVEGRIEEAAMA